MPGAVQGRGSGLGSGLGCVGQRLRAGLGAGLHLGPGPEQRLPRHQMGRSSGRGQASLCPWHRVTSCRTSPVGHRVALGAPGLSPAFQSLGPAGNNSLWPLPFPSLAPCTRHVLGPSVLSPLCLVWPCPCGQLPEGDSSLVWSMFCLSDLWRIRVRPEASPVCCPGLLHQ